jgi:oligopeptidase B
MRPAQPPIAAKRPAASRHHGADLIDEYAWLRAHNWQEVMDDPSKLDADIRAHLEAENSYTETMLADDADLRRALLAEMKGRIQGDDCSVPATDGPWGYYARFVAGAEYPKLCRCPSAGDGETVLLDGDLEAKGRPFWELAAAVHSPDHALLAYAVDLKGSELYTVRVRDLATGRNRPDVLRNTSGQLAWANDSRTLFYTRLDAHHRPLLVYRHTLGTSASEDALVYREQDPALDVHVGRTQSGAFVVITAEDHQTTEVWLIDADAPASAPRLVAPRRTGHQYYVEHHDDRLIITTNSGGAEDFRVCETAVSVPDMGGWREIVSHRPGCLILETAAFRRHLVRLEQENGLPRIVVRRWRDGAEHIVAFAEDAYALELADGFEFDSDMLRFVYSSMATPAQVFDYDMETRTRVLRKAQGVPSGYDPAEYVVRRLLAPTLDGETVPITLLLHWRTQLDGSAPLVLYGYGSYGDGLEANFSTTRLSLVDRGFIFALAHVRGGDEKGQRWHREGMGENKRNTFSDFIAAAEHLVASGVTRRGRIVAMGESAGGALMGAAANMTPDLFLSVVASEPFVDVLNTLLDVGLPLTPGEWPEWGNPIESKAAFDLIRSYCPYENVERKAYPHILACGALADQRVPYWEPAKWVARLRDRKTDDRLLLLRTDLSAGHAGAFSRFGALEESAFIFAFVIKTAGMIEHAAAPD